MKIPIYISIVFACIFLFSCRSEHYHSKCDLAQLDLQSTKETFLTGEKISFQIYSNTDMDCPFYLALNQGFGDHFFPIEMKDNHLSFNVPDEFSKKSGELTAKLIFNNKIEDINYVTILPGRAKGIAEIYCGPRSILANGQENAMAVMIPKDHFGNPVMNNEASNFQIMYPDGNIVDKRVTVSNLVSFMIFKGASTKGKIFIAGESGESAAKEQEIQIIPGHPSSIKAKVIKWVPYADARQYIQLATEIIRDENDNIVADG
ncbi:MAG: hypothetical protein R3250_15155, partial [Melioribacteraceae bacterium]|nr:hypothetical protein [Melioribacteraceae bacterium]